MYAPTANGTDSGRKRLQPRIMESRPNVATNSLNIWAPPPRAYVQTSFRRLCRSDKRAHELAVNFRRNCIDVDALPAQKCPCIVYSVNAGWFDTGIFKAGSRQL